MSERTRQALQELAAGMGARARARAAAPAGERELLRALEELEEDRRHLEGLEWRREQLSLQITAAREALELRRQELRELERWDRWHR